VPAASPQGSPGDRRSSRLFLQNNHVELTTGARREKSAASLCCSSDSSELLIIEEKNHVRTRSLRAHWFLLSAAVDLGLLSRPRLCRCVGRWVAYEVGAHGGSPGGWPPATRCHRCLPTAATSRADDRREVRGDRTPPGLNLVLGGPRGEELGGDAWPDRKTIMIALTSWSSRKSR
jgi:hypothetical protein